MDINATIVVDKTQPKRIIAILDDPFGAWFQQNLLPLETVNTTLSYGHLIDSNVGRFDYIITPDNRIMLISKPDNMSLGDAYTYIINHFNR